MFKKIKIILIVLVIISFGILGILFLQDRTKKLEDRKYNEIEKINIVSDNADINVYRSEDDSLRVVIYGTHKDFVEIIEGTKYLDISKKNGKNFCLLNCKNEIDLYVPESIKDLNITTEIGNVNFEKAYVKNIKINSEIGNINIYKTNVVNVTSDTGNINIIEIDAIDNSSLNTKVGNIVIDKIIDLKIDAKSELGSVVIPYIKEESEFTLKIETEKGNIDINHHENKSE